jgi:HSP20 family molecular chaperone IbpA
MSISTQESLTTARQDARAAERMETRPTIAPPVDIYENEDEILVIADVPGARSDSMAVRLDKQELTVHARCESSQAGDVLFGGPRADYARTFIVPRGIDAEKIGAEMKSGVLTIRLPKSAAVKPRRIQVIGA